MRELTAAVLACALTCSSCTGPAHALGVDSGTAPSAAPAHPLKVWLKQRSRAKKGAWLGAALGAVVGYERARVLGQDRAKGAAAGAVAGAIAGLLIGRHQDTLRGSRDEAMARLGYDPSRGYVLTVEEVRFEPQRVAPGQKAQVYVRYLVVGPDRDEELPIETFTGVKYGGNYVNARGPESFVVQHGGGIVEVRSEVTIPATAPKGTYTIEALLEDRNGRFQSSREAPLYVG